MGNGYWTNFLSISILEFTYEAHTIVHNLEIKVPIEIDEKLYSLTKIAKKIFISNNDFLFVLRIMSCATICINMNEINLKLPCLFWLMYQWHFN